MENYNKVKLRLEENGCILLTTFEEFEELREKVLKKSYQFVRVRFIGTCSHESDVVYTNFNIRKTGMICKNCTRIKCSNIMKNSKNSNEIESDGITIIEEYLSPHYEIIRTKEGCLADLAIRKRSEDQWIPIQVKVTMKISHGMYSFTLHKADYKNMLLICVCISEKKIWVIPYNHLSMQYKLNISIKSKYNNYLLDLNEIEPTIDKYRTDIICLPIDTILLPINPTQQREQEYVRKRETYVPFLKYEYPLIQNSCVDVIVNGKKVQEKVLGYTAAKKGLHCGISANNGKLDGKRQFRCYRLGENDFYWLHSSIDNRFWIIPERVLYEKGYLCNKEETKNKKILWFKSENNITSKWLDDYQYNYDTIDKEEVLKIFG
jgi:hypothetical protein